METKAAHTGKRLTLFISFTSPIGRCFMVAFDRNPQDFKYLRLLSRQFPTEQSAFTEIINLSAILNLPKGTEHFMSDVHGEYEAFMHILNNCSGVVREHVDEIFGDTLSFDEKGELCTLIYYPREKIELVRRSLLTAQAEIEKLAETRNFGLSEN